MDCDPQMGILNVFVAMKTKNGLGRLMSLLSFVVPPHGIQQRTRQSVRQNPAGTGYHMWKQRQAITIHELQCLPAEEMVFKDILSV